jgi:hypothetical protein
MIRALPLPMILLIAACASAPAPAPESAPAPAPTSAPTSAPAPAATSAPESAPAPAPLPTGGVVLIGEILSPPSFDAKSTLDGLKPALLSCYNRARQNSPTLHGKLKLHINVNETGAVLLVDAEPGGAADDATLVSCLGDAIKGAHSQAPRHGDHHRAARLPSLTHLALRAATRPKAAPCRSTKS